MAPRTRSQTKAPKANTALNRIVKAIPTPIRRDSSSSSSSSSSSLSSSYSLVLNALSAQRSTRSPTFSDSVDEEELHFVYQKCQVMMDNLDIHQTDFQDKHAVSDQIDSDGSFNDKALQSVYQKCQAMMDHLDLDQSHPGDPGDQQDAGENDSNDDFVEHSHSRPPVSACPPTPDSSQDDQGPSVHHIIMCSMARPALWAIAYQNLSTLKHQTWIEASVLNFFLLSLWYSVSGQTRVRYVDFFSAMLSISSGIHSLPDVQEIQLFQQRHMFDSLPADPSVPVAFVVLSSGHFFVVVFDYQENLALVLGRRISGNVSEDPDPYYDDRRDDWNGWNGPLYWMRIAALHGYDPVKPDQVDVQVRNWTQNGYDCGPIATFVMESLMNTGLYNASNSLHIPPIPCGHRLRLRMLATVKEACRRSWENYRYLSSTNLPPGDIWSQWDDTASVTEQTILQVQQEASGEQHASIIRELNVVAANCLVCQRANNIGLQRSQFVPAPSDSDVSKDQDDIEEDQPVLNSKSRRLKNLLRRYPYVSRARARDHLPSQAVHGRTEPVIENTFEIIQERKHVKDWTTGYMFRFPRPTPAVHLSAYEGHRWKTFDRSYDDYEGGPVLESLQQDRNPYEIVEEPYYRPGLWTSFRDYGYRLLPSFSQMFYLDPPIKLTDHILPVGITEDYMPSLQINNHVTGKYALCRRPTSSDVAENQVQVNDVVILSAAQMIKTGTANSEDLINTFICGRHQDRRHICLDLELDHVPLTSKDLDVVVDIDSLIWVTRSLHFHTPLAVYLGPILEDKAPMHKNNHVYVDILVPQSQEDADAIGDRTEWMTMSFPLCGIPHTVLGALSSASSAMMIHRDEMTHRHANRIPKEVLDFFWEHLLLPAIRQHADVGSAPYVCLTLNEVKFKARKGNSKKAGRPRAVPFTMELLKKIQSTMEDIIQQDPSRYANYGSFFFVLDCKGIKLWAKTSLFQEDTSLIKVLSSGIPALDWSYMVDRNNGELLVDLGIGIHPTCDQKLVGLWRLDALEASFGAGGFLRGNIHHTCTLGRYGGIQAEMSQERARQTHVAFRSAYNLSYEVVRPNDNMPTFVMDKDAYALNNGFMEECTQAIRMYSGEAKKRSYGVRDEYRMGGMAMEHVMAELSDKMKAFIDSDPILWIPSEVWFEFLSQRVRALQLAQIDLYNLNPSNLGILTGILCHLIRCTSSTPIILDYHVRESMALLQFSRICERFGMFFLMDLDLQKTPLLPAVQQYDDLEVLKLMQAKLKKKDGRPIWPRLASNNDSEQFPIGNMPTWAMVIKTIRDQPWLIMQSWMWSADLSYLEPVVGKLFVQFTCQLWIQMDDAWLMDPEQRPEPTSLQDAIQSWSLNTIFVMLRACTFKACNADIPGSAGTGRRQASFAERMNVYFPDPTQDSKPAHRSPWSVFWTKPGYIWEYHHLIQDYMTSEMFEVTDRLGKIFSLLQTLPDSIKGTSKTPGRTWRSEDDKVVLATNPKFYKIEGLSVETGVQRTRKKTNRVLKPRNKLQMDLMEHAGYGDLLASRALLTERQKLQEARKRKSGKAKNARKPPAKQTKAQMREREAEKGKVGEEEEEGELEEEEFADNECDNV
ncbi:hypothetical protein V8E55_001296 [Tylopilus felleus]